MIITGFEPKAIPGSTKYGTAGGCTTTFLRALELPSEITESLAKWGNLGVTKSTWSSYKTAQTMLDLCRRETGVCMDLPLTNAKTLAFIDWLARVRKLRAATIKTYLSGIRQLHIVQGLESPELRTGLVKLVLKGIDNRDGIATRAGKFKGRLPMTKNTMLLFKKLTQSSKYAEQDKLLIWAVATLAFAGAFRIHEILSKAESTFDPNFTLLGEDLTVSSKNRQETLHVRLKCPKESRSAAATVVDVFENKSELCPVRAFRKWFSCKFREPHLPLFRFHNGTPLTGAKLNRVMKTLLDPYTDSSVGFFATHSFRIGIASMLGQLGFEDQDIMATGRWSSRVFERYMKLTRTKRNIAQDKILSRRPHRA